MPPKKKNKQDLPTLFGANRQDLLRGLSATHVGRRILLSAKDLYGAGNVPIGEENLLHQYSIVSLNTDMATAVIAYDEKCITEGGNKFRDYPLTDDDEGEISDYKMLNFDEHHELYNVHLGRVNKKVNDLKEKQRKIEAEMKIAAAEDVSDIERKLSNGIDPYLIIVGEFRSAGPLLTHIIQKGDNKGKSSKKQEWEHIHSGYRFVWHYAFTKNEFARDKPWKVAREIMKKSMTGQKRIAAIMNAAKMPMSSGTDSDGFRYVNFDSMFIFKHKHTHKLFSVHDTALTLLCSLLSQEIDIVLRVAAVKACVGAKFALAVSENVFFQNYLKQLNPGHRPPYRLERIRILECMIDYAKQELGWIMDERRKELVKNFMSGTIDFWTDPHRKQQFGCFVVDLTAEKYKMKNGMTLFMSRRTKKRIEDELFISGTPVLDALEYPMNFEAFVSVHHNSFHLEFLSSAAYKSTYIFSRFMVRIIRRPSPMLLIG